MWSSGVRSSTELHLKQGCALIKVTSKCWCNFLQVLEREKTVLNVGIIQIIITQKLVKTTA